MMIVRPSPDVRFERDSENSQCKAELASAQGSLEKQKMINERKEEEPPVDGHGDKPDNGDNN